nr:hypothetical protein [Tanacetum cinerariifolium]
GVTLRGTPGLLRTRIGRSVRLMTPVSLVTSITGIPVVTARVVVVIVAAAVVVIATSPIHYGTLRGSPHESEEAKPARRSEQPQKG